MHNLIRRFLLFGDVASRCITWTSTRVSRMDSSWDQRSWRRLVAWTIWRRSSRESTGPCDLDDGRRERSMNHVQRMTCSSLSRCFLRSSYYWMGSGGCRWLHPVPNRKGLVNVQLFPVPVLGHSSIVRHALLSLPSLFSIVC